MGIKTYDIKETKQILNDYGFETEPTGCDMIYIKSKVLLHKDSGVYRVMANSNCEALSLYSGFSEDEACRKLLKHLGIKTVATKKKKEQIE